MVQFLSGVTVELSLPPPPMLEQSYHTLLSPAAVQFVAEIVKQFDAEVDEILQQRVLRKLQLDRTGALPDFSPETQHIRTGDWTVDPVPSRLQCRHVDLGDVSPSNREHFVAALKSKAQGIQVDFDDGHCPSWFNQLRGLYHVRLAVHNSLPGVPDIAKAPVLMLRPRAWNMVEHNMLVNGKEVPGPLFDFALLMFHNSRILLDSGSGPFFYLSKLEGSNEVRLWNRIFDWAEQKLGLQRGCVKACILIENILASFQMHEMLFELQHHSAGLNCGMWDYSASFVNKFGHREDFVLPDRRKYVSMERHFLKSYLNLVVQTSHRRHCHATGGMTSLLLGGKTTYQNILTKVLKSKTSEIAAGVDGFLVYDLGLVEPMQQLFQNCSPNVNQLSIARPDVAVVAKDLLTVPAGGVTADGLKHNIAVGVLFIYSWLTGRGHFVFKGAVEDSATAEISRSQVWQWIRHGRKLEDDGKIITKSSVHSFLKTATKEICDQLGDIDGWKLQLASEIFEQIVSKQKFPEFITTYLNAEHAFLHSQKTRSNL